MAIRARISDDGSGRSIERDLGALENGLATLINEFTEERRGAAEHRRDMRQVMGALSESVRVMSVELAETRRNTASELSEMKPLMIDYRTRRDETKGAARLLRGFYAFLVLIATAGAGLVGYKIHGGP